MKRVNSKLIIRVVSFILVVFLVLGMLVVVFRSSRSEAAEYAENMNVRIGISYGSSVAKSYRLTSPGGFDIGYCTSSNDFVSQYSTGSDTVFICRNSNLNYSSGSYIPTTSSEATVGAYHVEFTIDTQVAPFEEQYAEISEILSDLGISCFRACVGKGLCIRAGNYTTYDAAKAAYEKIIAKAKFYCNIVSPSDSGLTVVNGANGAVLFEFDNGGSLNLALSASSANGKYYLGAPDGYSYDGVFAFSRYSEGICAVNVIPLETYIEGVLPYEISSSWNIETQKAFACAVRSYTLANLGKHKNQYGFDLCNTTDCQVYRGVKGVNNTVKNAVNSTRNMVLTYDGKIVSAYYSSSTGGSTASAYDVWGGTSFPYLSGVPTPWERYDSHPGGSWTVEISGEELYSTLNSKGYSGLKGRISDVKINNFASNSTYVKTITFTDVYGNSISIGKCDKVRLALSKHLKSANFVVAKGGQKVDIINYTSDTDFSYAKNTKGINVLTFMGNKVLPKGSTFHLLTSTGTSSHTDYGDLRIISSEGLSPLTASDYSALPDIAASSFKTTKKTVTAQGSSSNFVFIGRGYGHGVGMSQYGAKDLGDIGYSYDAIVAAYFPKIELTNLNNIK